MRSTFLLATAVLIAAFTDRAVTQAVAQSADDSAAIRAAALDYIEGWYAGDPERMARAVHPELVKRIVVINQDTGEPFIDNMGAGRLVEGTRAAYGRETPAEERRTDVTILDVFGNAASVKIDAGGWIDYLHMAKMDGRWSIVNVLWERRQ
ncbi:MAG TPA: nuclear transport factor 2 family protein [Thermoanaerobaculia bacterium]|jgi:hypothetical protein